MRTCIRILSGAAALALAACTTTPHLDSRFGAAVSAARAAQTANPEASRNPDPVAGMDGRAARETMERYQESFRAPPRTFEVIIGTTGEAAQ
jgi:hypothetical protein